MKNLKNKLVDFSNTKTGLVTFIVLGVLSFMAISNFGIVLLTAIFKI